MRSQRSRSTAERVLKAQTNLAHQIARDDGAETDAVRNARIAVAQARPT